MGDENLNAVEIFEECNEPDFTDTDWSLAHLPDVILVRVMKFLGLKDRYYLSVTCKRLNEFFTHPDLWKVAYINLLNQGRRKQQSRWDNASVMPKTISEIVKRFSHLFQHLHLQTPSIIKPFESPVIDMLKDLANDCRLERLTLSVGVLESKDEDIQAVRNFYSNTKDVHLITALLRNAIRLKHLSIMSWPLLADSNENGIFQSILSNTKLKSLESMSLFYIDRKAQWTGRVPNLPLPEQITEIFAFLPNLTHISLRSPMINDDVICALASDKRKSLKVLEVLIMWSRATSAHGGCNIPDISEESWHKLRIASPHVKVEFLIHIRIPFDELMVMFKPEIPLSSVRILKYGQCEHMLIDLILSKYSQSLTSFVSLCDSDGCDKSLLNLIKECTFLDELLYHGNINFETVMQMADVIKEHERATQFEFREQNIKTDNLNVDDEDNDEVVVVRNHNEGQEYVLAAVQAWHYDEELHRRKLDTMLTYVKDILGNPMVFI